MAKAQATVMKNGRAVEHRTFPAQRYGQAYANASTWAQTKAASIKGTWRVTRIEEQ